MIDMGFLVYLCFLVIGFKVPRLGSPLSKKTLKLFASTQLSKVVAIGDPRVITSLVIFMSLTIE